MIGQRRLQNQIEGQTRRDRFPHFAIFIGEKGCGKSELAHEVATQLGAMPVVSNSAVDSIRSMIQDATKITESKLLYIINGDYMSQSAANALLKIAEEPPKNLYIILTVSTDMNLFGTVKSRGVCYRFDPYEYDELSEFYDNITEDATDKDFIVETASTPGDIVQLVAYKSTDFKDFVHMVIDHVSSVTGANALKIGNRIQTKDDDRADAFDMGLFLKAFTSICCDRINTDSAYDGVRYCRAIAITGDVLTDLRIRGLNKQMLFDTWVLKIREVWHDD